MSKTLMLYYTFTGNTEFVSERMKELIPDLTVERLIAENEPPKKALRGFSSAVPKLFSAVIRLCFPYSMTPINSKK